MLFIDCEKVDQDCASCQEDCYLTEEDQAEHQDILDSYNMSGDYYFQK
jgi:hypothetical protein